MSSISIDSIVPKHRPSVDIMNAQITPNMTHGTFTFSGTEDASNNPVSITCGYYLTLMSPHAFVEIEGFGGATGSGAAVTSTTNLPANMRPALVQYVPVRVTDAGASPTSNWGTLKVGTDGSMKFYGNAAELVFTNASVISANNVSAKWCTLAF